MPNLTERLWDRFGWVVALLSIVWSVEALNLLLGRFLTEQFGLVPRAFYGLDGVIAMPILHASPGHAAANTLPLAILGGLVAATVKRSLWMVNSVIVLGGGMLVWLFAGTAIHVGASGLIFGWFAFLVVRGMIDRSLLTMSIAAGVGLVYGTMLWGVLPGQEGVSWESHLFGALSGAAAAWLTRGRKA